jgi:hypothetical protein
MVEQPKRYQGSETSKQQASSKQATNKAKQTSGTQIPGKTVV